MRKSKIEKRDEICVRGGDVITGSGKTKMATRRSNDACTAWRKCAWKTAATFLHKIILRTCCVCVFEPDFTGALLCLKSVQNIDMVSGRQAFTSQFVPYNKFA